MEKLLQIQGGVTGSRPCRGERRGPTPGGGAHHESPLSSLNPIRKIQPFSLLACQATSELCREVWETPPPPTMFPSVTWEKLSTEKM